MGYSDKPQYTAPLGPPSYETATKPVPEKKKGSVRRWLEERKDRKGSKGEEGSSASKETTPEERPPAYD